MAMSPLFSKVHDEHKEYPADYIAEPMCCPSELPGLSEGATGSIPSEAGVTIDEPKFEFDILSECEG